MEHFRSRNRVRGFGGIICGVERERGASPLRLAADEWHKLAPSSPLLWYLLQQIFSAYYMMNLPTKTHTSSVSVVPGSNGTKDRPQLSTLGFMNLHWQAGWRGIIFTTQLSSDYLFCWSNLVLLFEFQTILLGRPWVFVFQFRTHLKIAASNLLASN